MITIAETIEKLIARYPLYGEAMAEEIVNYSALARKLQPQVEEMRMEPVTEGAMIMALKRLGAKLKEKQPNVEVVHKVRNITVRSDLAEMAFRNSPNMGNIHKELLKEAESFTDPFVDFAQGRSESTFVISSKLLPILAKLSKNEVCIARFENLSSISIQLPDDTVNLPGVYYPFVKAFAWERINFVEIISYFTELNFVVAEEDVERAFSVIKGLAKRGEEMGRKN